MSSALIGFSGFVGSTLLKQSRFDALYRSTTIQEIKGREFDVLVCAGAPAQKWLANRSPEEDKQKIDYLIDALGSVRCKTFILISTVDVFKTPLKADESTPVEEQGLLPYGLHRRLLEKFVAEQFPHSLIVRLPGLVGPGLRKNVIFDFLHLNNLQAIDSRAIFQFYPMVNLWNDIQVALQAGLSLVHLTAAPIAVEQVSLLGFGREFTQQLSAEPARYDMRSLYAPLFGGQEPYQYSLRETVQAIRAYAQSDESTHGSYSGGQL